MLKRDRRIFIIILLGLFLVPGVIVRADPPPTDSNALSVSACVGDPCSTTTTTTTTTGTTTTGGGGSTGTGTTGGTTGGSGGGGGGGGSGFGSVTSVVLNGRAYPLSKVTVLEDGVPVITTIAGPDAKFSVTISSLTGGVYTFSVFSLDDNNLRSTPFTIPISITTGATTTISGIFLAPTINIDKSEVKQGDFLAIFGQSVPNAEVHIAVHSANELDEKVETDANGAYLYNLDTSLLDLGGHTTNSKAMITSTNEATSDSATLAFTVGDQDKTQLRNCPAKGDLNKDCKVNLVDFSILAFWYKKPNPPAAVDLNGDGKVDLIDFSIMAYYWTG